MRPTKIGDDLRRRRSTSYDVAELAGTSQSAVSRCFTPGAHISADMRARIMSAAETLGYQPSPVARELITGRSNLVGVVISDETGIAYPELLYSLSRSFERHEVRIVLVALPSQDVTLADLASLRSQRLKGVVLATDLPDPLIRAMMSDDIQIVQYNRGSGRYPLPMVSCDHRECGWLLAQLLIDAGHRQFGLIEGPESSSVGTERLRGVSDCLAESGLADPVRVRGNFGYDGGAEGARRLCAVPSSRPDVIVAANDLMALGALDTLRVTMKLKVPDEISIAGFDGVSQGRWSAYDLTTIRQPLSQMADTAAEMLIARLADHQIPAEKRFFSGELVAGSSARLLPMPVAASRGVARTAAPVRKGPRSAGAVQRRADPNV